MQAQLIDAVRDNNPDVVRTLLRGGADPNSRDAESGLTALMLAAGQASPALVRVLLDAGADVLTIDPKAGASALHKACQGGSLEVVRMLVEAGAFVDAVAVTTGHTALMDALWFKWPAIVEYLLDQNVGLNISTHYGFSLAQHVEYELNVTVIGKDRFLQAEKALQARQQSDQTKIENQKLMAAVTNNDIATVKQLLETGVDVDERYPYLNSFNDAHTPLLVASRDGHTEIVTALLAAGADVNATEPTFGAVPLHKAVYNGHADITQILVEQPDININFQGATNGYTPLHDALWHGFADCADILIQAGARLDLKGHDGKTPLDLALEVFGSEHATVELIQSRLEPVQV